MRFLLLCRLVTCIAIGLTVAELRAQQIAPQRRPNVLLLVADDMNWDSPGCFGGVAPDVTPHIDRLASQGMRFWHAHANISVCTPSRSVMLTGLYPQHNGAEGFQRIRPGTATLPAILSNAGYLCGTIGKPLRQQELFHWSVNYRWQGTGDEDRWGRDPDIYRRFAAKFFAMAKTSQQPFFLMASSHDPHRPFAKYRRQGDQQREHFEAARPSRTYTAREVRVPNFLPDIPEVRQEIAAYATAVRRLDDMVGAVLQELDTAQLNQDTIVIFLSDHGMPFPGAKFNCYVDSTRSPWIVRWPRQVKAGTNDRAHMLSTVDLLPTILQAVGLPAGKPTDGRSFLPVLRGGSQPDRDHVFTQFNHIHGADALPMRAVQTKSALYVFNPWSNGKRTFRRLGGGAFQGMQRLATTDEGAAERIRYLRFRRTEELYDLRTDPHCLNNCLNEEENQETLNALQHALRGWMVQVGDPALTAFDNREEPAALERFMREYAARAAKEVAELQPYEKAQRYTF